MKKKKGFTLVELIAVIGISAIFGAIVLSIALTSGKLFNMAQTDSVNNDKARLIIGTIEDDLRTSSNIVGTPTSLAMTTEVVIGSDHYALPLPGAKVVLSFKKSDGGVYAYTYIEPVVATGTKGELIRMKYDTGINEFKAVSGGYSDVSKITVKKNIVATDNKRYTIDLEFEGGAKYNSVITPRN